MIDLQLSSSPHRERMTCLIFKEGLKLRKGMSRGRFFTKRRKIIMLSSPSVRVVGPPSDKEIRTLDLVLTGSIFFLSMCTINTKA